MDTEKNLLLLWQLFQEWLDACPGEREGGAELVLYSDMSGGVNDHDHIWIASWQSPENGAFQLRTQIENERKRHG